MDHQQQPDQANFAGDHHTRRRLWRIPGRVATAAAGGRILLPYSPFVPLAYHYLSNNDQHPRIVQLDDLTAAIDNNNSSDGLSEKSRSQSREVCAVCLDALCQENNNIGVLECKHEYHSDCIKKWLRVKNFCPMSARSRSKKPRS
ncbi:hypothetical protein MIMGU_mgv1a022531mg [Erythranthe guttata]|uniref:RING-type E3 ubiquitin transferase n=1 Tax=Erythranthe guttata TaxID=4155 RepID=A0A022RM83_ERYGU|nr:hypothetical protein MIMGU_mgv1a022531mg [Erythranthe guttata]